MAVMILIAGALIGVVLGRVFKVAVIAPVSFFAACASALGGLSETQSAIVTIGFALAVPIAMQMGYLFGLASLPAPAQVPVKVRAKRAPL